MLACHINQLHLREKIVRLTVPNACPGRAESRERANTAYSDQALLARMLDVAVCQIAQS